MEEREDDQPKSVDCDLIGLTQFDYPYLKKEIHASLILMLTSYLLLPLQFMSFVLQ